MIKLGPQDDQLAYRGPAAPTVADAAWFDRFYFDLHGPDGRPAVVVGGAIYPSGNLQDAYVVAVIDGEQRNLRLSGELSAAPQPGTLGPLSWQTIEPLKQWQLQLAPNPSGVEFDLTWMARSPAWAVHPISIAGSPEAPGVTDFNHFFQAGYWSGTLTIDGQTRRVDGWSGQRDRSRGWRRARDRLGMHLWIAAQMPNYSVGCNFNLDRQNQLSHFDGAVLGENGSARAIRGMRHHMEVDSLNLLQRGRVVIDMVDGESFELAFDSIAPGLYMAGGGYGGWHGIKRGPLCMEHERWPMDGSINPLTLPLGLVQTPSRFTRDGETGHGLVELALSRSASYRYQSDLA